MGFTTPCFILMNTPNLRNKLSDIGYRIGNKYHIQNAFLATDNDEMFGINTLYSPEQCEGYIYCRTNEPLFLAIAALRDDIDKHQWFTDGNKWFQCPEIKFSTYWVYNDIEINIDTIHKATVNELIEHFRDKKK